MDEWTPSGARITDPKVLETLRRVLEDEGPLIVEHRHYRGSSAPDRLVFEGERELEAYLTSRVRPGDDVWVWSFLRICTDEAAVAHGKIPDEHGRTPKGGAY